MTGSGSSASDGAMTGSGARVTTGADAGAIVVLGSREGLEEGAGAARGKPADSSAAGV